MSVAIVGVTGVTGGLAFDIAESRGLMPVAIGRNHEKLRAFLAARNLDDERLRVADTHDAVALRAALATADYVISTVAPYSLHGFSVAQAAAELGMGYVDSTGEGRFALRVADELDAVARRTGATLCPGTGASAFVGDVALRFLPDRSDAVSGSVVYDIVDYKPSFGSLLSYFTTILPTGGALIRDGEVQFQPFGAFAAQGAGCTGYHGVLIDPAVVARYWRPARFDALFKGSRAMRPLVRAFMAVLASAPIRALMLKLPLEKLGEFDRTVDDRSSVTAHAEIRLKSGETRCCSLRGASVYSLTATALVATVQGMQARPQRPVGVRAASEMFGSLDEAMRLSGLTRVG